MPADNEAASEARDDDLAVMAAMTLIASDDHWSIDNAARALGRSPDWLRNEIDKVAQEEAQPN